MPHFPHSRWWHFPGQGQVGDVPLLNSDNIQPGQNPSGTLFVANLVKAVMSFLPLMYRLELMSVWARAVNDNEGRREAA